MLAGRSSSRAADRGRGGHTPALFRTPGGARIAIGVARPRSQASGPRYRTLVVDDHFDRQLTLSPALTAALAVTSRIRLGSAG